MHLENILEWYQQRISLYDKQSWETTVEQRILRGLSYSPRKTTKQKTDLIDVDLVRGSTFPKAKPQSDVWIAGLHGILKLILLPIYFRWWMKEATYIGFVLISGVYCSVATSSLIYYSLHESQLIKIVPGSEVLLPVALLCLLSIILSQMACTRRKGIKVAFRGKRIGRILRNGRKSRSSRKNSLIGGVKGYSKNMNASEDHSKSVYTLNAERPNRLFDPTCRSHSEDLHSTHTFEFENRSASESNLLSFKKCPGGDNTDDQTSPEADVKSPLLAPSKPSSTTTPIKVSSQEKWNSAPREECNVRYRGYVTSKYKGEGRKEFPSTRGLGGFPSSQFERSSDGCSDGEGCHADWESPSTDEEEVSQRGKKPKFKLGPTSFMQKPDPLPSTHHPTLPFVVVRDGSNSSCDSEGEKVVSSIPSQYNNHKPLFGDWVGITTNSEDPSYSSESEAGWGEDLAEAGHPESIDWHIQGSPAAVISSNTNEVDKVGCKIWEESEMKKVDLSVLDISSVIISRVDSLHQSSTYLMFGLIMAGILSLVPSLYRLLTLFGAASSGEGKEGNETITPHTDAILLPRIFGGNYWCFGLIVLNAANRFVLGSCFFFLLSVAERTFKQRFLYAKHFCYLTSARRARKYDLPHFRLNKVINIKSWLSIRSCLKKRGPQHSVDVIISATFIVTLLLVFYLGVEALKDEEKNFQPLHNCELFVWCFAVSIYLIRFMTLGALINKKYSNPSVLITEQINMYLHMEQNPQKKDNLMLANNVLKLVSVLLKELDSPFKISGLSANTLLYNITKFGILSACSGVLSNLLGFKLKLHNIKFR